MNMFLEWYSSLSFFFQMIMLFNTLALTISFLVLWYKKSITLFLTTFLFIRYLLYFISYKENLGEILEFLGSSTILLLVAYSYEYNIKIRLNSGIITSFKAITLILVVVGVALDSYKYNNISIVASITYIILLLPVIQYTVINREIGYKLFIVYTIFVLLASSDIRELVNLLWLYWDVHKYRLLTKEQLLIWITALVILYNKVNYNRKLILIGVVTLIIGNILQVPPILTWVCEHNPYNINSYIIRLTPLPLVYGIKPKTIKRNEKEK